MNSILTFFIYIVVFESVVEISGDIVCGPGDTYLVNPVDCSSFYQCNNGIPSLLFCAPDHGGSLVFNPNLNFCVWPQEYDCQIETSPPSFTIPYNLQSTYLPYINTTDVQGTSQSSTRSVVCDPGDTYLPNPHYCSSFYQCTNGIPLLQYCAPDHGRSLVFNPFLNVCVWPEEYDCRITTTTRENPAMTTETPTLNSCHNYNHPTSCLNSSSSCSFCFDACFRKGNFDVPRCDTYENLVDAGCRSFEINESEYGSVIKTSINCSTWLPVIAGKKRYISVTFSLEKHPLDLYYLMDFSGSMFDDKRNLVSLSTGLLDTLGNLTNDFHIGFGTFVDKPKKPFGSKGDYSFRNNLPLTSATENFVTKVEAIPILDGGDEPESHADAMTQVIECAEQIGWRENTRRVVLLATDINFHIAEDGITGNITAPYVDGCYLGADGSYSEELTMDYPSVEQLARAYSKKQSTTTAIFATSSHTVSFYENVASQFKSAYVGVLKSDSSNILDLIKNGFAKIDSKMEIEKSETSDIVRFRYYSNCMGLGGELETAICENLPSFGEVTFIVEIDLTECPVYEDETGIKIQFNPVGLPIFIDVELSYLCQ